MSRTTAKYKIVRRNSPMFTLGVPCNVKIKGEKVMRKNVVLDVHESDPYLVRVRTGKRGRPAALPVAQIERQRVLRAS